MDAARILAVDDEPHILALCREALDEAGFRVDTVPAAAEALGRLEPGRYDLLLTDLRMPGRSGLELLRAARGADPDLPVVVFTAFPSVESAVEAMRAGADDFLPKPFSTDHLCHVVRRALERRRLERENRLLKAQLVRSPEEARLEGRSRVMRQLLDLLKRVAPTDANVLILGESGTGKELVARALHAHSLRGAQPFVPLDCAALPETLLESELFGFEKGAFTGAAAQRTGLVESAHGGTLFLDEIGDLSVGLQAKLLRVLQERQLRRVGGQALIPVNVRVIAATHVDLPRAVREGHFREDLYFRLNVIPLRVPALRERTEDIPILVESMLREFGARHSGGPIGITGEALDRLKRYSWPGNVRELRNALERMALLIRGTEITAADLPAEVLTAEAQLAVEASGGGGFRGAKRQVVQRFEREFLHRLLTQHEGNVSRSAREARLNRSAFQRLMKKHGLRSTVYRASAEMPRN